MSDVLDMRAVGIHLGRGKGRREVLRDVTLRIAPGETLGLIGSSGSGKTTAGRIALGLLRPDSGTATVCGTPYRRSRREHAGKVQAVLQSPQWSFNPRRRLGDSIIEPLGVVDRGLDRMARKERCAALLVQVGLLPVHAERYPHELSGGQRQRAAIARALITEPEFVVFDEAVSALDVAVQQKVLRLIRKLQDTHGFGALFISHDLAAVRVASDRIAVMLAGEIVEQGAPGEVLDHPEHAYTRRLIETL
ncbi:dipeptide/oligopeptide/nickel ABC transporter ATP-binding protein [Nocardioides sp. LHD-245]|uniref:ABC transporter ATP-binding protein n=1 Tax=Nocardioides sp. LHD-245 TaxID=3051387 RepID=UPI0027E133C8|nr:dipeptide/oligopeptide/nickel ABC transporter ATP-binding protein [Nocardioides sp. LHD-245]